MITDDAILIGGEGYGLCRIINISINNYRWTRELILKRESGICPVKLLKLKSLDNKNDSFIGISGISPNKLITIGTLSKTFWKKKRNFVREFSPVIWIIFEFRGRLEPHFDIAKPFFITETYTKDRVGYSLKLEGMEAEMLLFLKDLQFISG